MSNDQYNLLITTDIESCSYTLSNSDDRINGSSVTITNSESTRKAGLIATDNGLVDLRLGAIHKNEKCKTCNNSKLNCQGHFGIIKLNYPVMSPHHSSLIFKWIHCICFECGSLLIPYDPLKNKSLDDIKATIDAKYNSKNNIVQCPVCNVQSFQKARLKRNSHVVIMFKETGKKLDKYVKNKDENKIKLSNVDIYNAFQRIRDIDVINLGYNIRSHPKNLILYEIVMPPNNIRQDNHNSTSVKGGKSDQTKILAEIVKLNNSLSLSSSNLTHQDIEARENLDNLYKVFQLGGSSESKGQQKQKIEGIANMMSGKTGQIRNHILGKRCENMIRSVITGDPLLEINMLGVPVQHAKSLEIPVEVNKYNMALCQKWVYNGNNYPGCRSIKKKDGTVYMVNKNINHVLEIGDIVNRHMLDGDYIAFNRQPSLSISSIAGMVVKVIHSGETLRMNPAICNYFNADFDGDQMNGIIAQSAISRIECKLLCGADRWFISPHKQAPLSGAFQDGLSGIAEISKFSEKKISKWKSMDLFSNTNLSSLTFKKSSYTNRELISKILPKRLTYYAKPSWFKEEYAMSLNYNPEDIKLEIKNGKLISGILDKKTTGQDEANSIFHTIANTYSSKAALNLIYNMQQVTHKFLMSKGFSLGYSNLLVNKKHMKDMKAELTNIMENAKLVKENIDIKNIPENYSLYDYIEEEQNKQLDLGEKLIKYILRSMDIDNNILFKMILYGSKGKISNFNSMVCAIGNQLIRGKCIGHLAGYFRTSSYFPAGDTSPKVNGFIEESFIEGIPNYSYHFAAAEARSGIIANALSTAKSGYIYRQLARALECSIIDNYKRVNKGIMYTQILYANTGFDPARLEKYEFNLYMTKQQLKDKYYSYDSEFENILNDTKIIVDTIIKLEKYNVSNYTFNNFMIPINVNRLLLSYPKPTKGKKLSAKVHEKMMNDFIEELPKLVYYNSKYSEEVPVLYKEALFTTIASIRRELYFKKMKENEITEELFSVILKEIQYILESSTIDYGYPIGILTAQCIAEPMTQYTLDSKHRTGIGAVSKFDAVDYIKSILTGGHGKDAKKLNNMLVVPKKNIISDKILTKRLANELEAINIRMVCDDIAIIYEPDENTFISEFQKDMEDLEISKLASYRGKNSTIKSFWCIRLSININTLRNKNLSIFEVAKSIENNVDYESHDIQSLRIHYSYNEENPFIRIYPVTSSGSNGEFFNEVLSPLVKKIKENIIRGIADIESTEIIEYDYHELEDIKLIKKKGYAIKTVGSNLADILANTDVDQEKTQTSALTEYANIYGIFAARNRIVDMIVTTLPSINRIYAATVANEMCSIGSVTGINARGIKIRDKKNVGLRAAFQTPANVFSNAAIDNQNDKLYGISSRLIAGSIPKMGSNYNEISFIPSSKKISIDDI